MDIGGFLRNTVRSAGERILNWLSENGVEVRIEYHAGDVHYQRVINGRSEADRRAEEVPTALEGARTLVRLGAAVGSAFVVGTAVVAAGVILAAPEILGTDLYNGQPPSYAEEVIDQQCTSFEFNENQPESCPVCLEHFKKGDAVYVLPCLHHYHRDCIMPWLVQTGQCSLFDGLTFRIVPLGSLKGKVRRDIITARLKENGATDPSSTDEPEYYIVARDADVQNVREFVPEKSITRVIDVAWVSESLAALCRLNPEQFIVLVPETTKPKTDTEKRSPPTTKQRLSGESEPTPNKTLADIFDRLAEMVSSSPVKRDTFRAFAYRKAAAVVRSFKKPLRTEEDADDVRDRLGPKTIEKIKEYIRTGKVEKIEILRSEDPTAAARIQLAGIWGVGPRAATDLIRQGYSTVEQLRESGQRLLNANQRTGLKYYEELLPKMPRSEVEEIAAYIGTVCKEMFGDELEMIVCGSYRRGAEFCSDADLLFSWKPGPRPDSGRECLGQLVDALKERKFIVDYFNKNNHHTIFLGICRLGPDRSARRFDMKVWPRESLACAVLHFTGNADFNRRLRLYAKRHGFKLSDLGLTRADGAVVKCCDESEVFHALGLDYVAPADRTSAAELRTLSGASWSEDEETSSQHSTTSLSD